MRESLQVLRLRDFRLLFGATAVSVFGDRIVAVALAFAVLELGGSASDVGLVLAARTLPLLGCLLIGGVVADRTSRMGVMIAADLVRFAAQALLAVLLIAGSAELWMVALLSGVTGAATGFFSPASTGLLPAVVSAEQLQPANGLRATAMGASEILGPAVAGVLVAATSPGWALAADAATFALSAAFLVGLRLPDRLPRAAASFMADMRDGWDAFRSRTWVWSYVASAAFGNMVWGAWSVLGPVVAARELGGAAAWGTILAALGVGALLGGLGAIRSAPRRPLVVSALSIFFMVAPLALLAAGAGVAPVGLAALVGGAGMFFGNAVWEAALQRHVPAETLSRVSAYDWFGSLAFQPLGFAIWGPISVAIGIDASLWLAAALLGASALAVLAVPDVRRLTNRPATAVGA